MVATTRKRPRRHSGAHVGLRHLVAAEVTAAGVSAAMHPEKVDADCASHALHRRAASAAVEQPLDTVRQPQASSPRCRSLHRTVFLVVLLSLIAMACPSVQGGSETAARVRRESRKPGKRALLGMGMYQQGAFHALSEDGATQQGAVGRSQTAAAAAGEKQEAVGTRQGSPARRSLEMRTMKKFMRQRNKVVTAADLLDSSHALSSNVFQQDANSLQDHHSGNPVPYVEVWYHGLSQNSLTRLQGLMQQWAAEEYRDQQKRTKDELEKRTRDPANGDVTFQAGTQAYPGDAFGGQGQSNNPHTLTGTVTFFPSPGSTASTATGQISGTPSSGPADQGSPADAEAGAPLVHPSTSAVPALDPQLMASLQDLSYGASSVAEAAEEAARAAEKAALAARLVAAQAAAAADAAGAGSTSAGGGAPGNLSPDSLPSLSPSGYSESPGSDDFSLPPMGEPQLVPDRGNVPPTAWPPLGVSPDDPYSTDDFHTGTGEHAQVGSPSSSAPPRPQPPIAHPRTAPSPKARPSQEPPCSVREAELLGLMRVSGYTAAAKYYEESGVLRAIATRALILVPASESFSVDEFPSEYGNLLSNETLRPVALRSMMGFQVLQVHRTDAKELASSAPQLFRTYSGDSMLQSGSQGGNEVTLYFQAVPPGAKPWSRTQVVGKPLYKDSCTLILGTDGVLLPAKLTNAPPVLGLPPLSPTPLAPAPSPTGYWEYYWEWVPSPAPAPRPYPSPSATGAPSPGQPPSGYWEYELVPYPAPSPTGAAPPALPGATTNNGPASVPTPAGPEWEYKEVAVPDRSLPSGHWEYYLVPTPAPNSGKQ